MMKSLLLVVAMCCVCLALPSQNLKQRKKRDITSTQGCGGVLTAPQGDITSPNFPNNYPDSSNCSWIITTTSKIKITFTDFDIESYRYLCLDKLQIFAGNSPQELCGQVLPPPITASQNTVKIIFTSDNMVAGKGFRLIYQPDYSTDSVVAPPITTTRTTPKTTSRTTPTIRRTAPVIYNNCGGVLTDSEGVITSPNFPDNYPDNAYCEWNIIATSRIKLTPTNFDLEGYMYLCDSDRIWVYGGSFPRKLCGQMLPDPIISTGNSMRIVFVTDKSLNRTGFKFIYQPV
ncbi:CUB domain-containing protein 2-like [Lithobates pipiens]